MPLFSRLQSTRFRAQCNFCKKNKEPEHVYSSHRLHDEAGNVTCPQLYNHRCELCGATGSAAHTRSYCPNAVQMRRANWRNPSSSDEPPDSSVSSPASTSGQPEDPNAIQPVEISVRHDRGFRNMSPLTRSRHNSAGRVRRQYRHIFHN